MTYTEITTRVAVYSILREAIARGQSVVISYDTKGEGRDIKRRVIVPERIVECREGDVVRASDNLREGVISLRLDRILAIATLDAVLAGEVPPGFDTYARVVA